MSRLRLGAIALIAALISTGCTSTPEDEPEKYGPVKLAVAHTPDTWLSDDYEHGFGEVWKLDRSEEVCGIHDDVVLLGRDGDLVAVRMADKSTVWQSEGQGCISNSVVDGDVYISTKTGASEQRWERVEISTGERTPVTGEIPAVGRFRPVAHADGRSWVLMLSQTGGMQLRASDADGRELWRADTDDLSYCKVLDGGAAGTPKRFGCWSRTDKFVLIDAETGRVVTELEVAPPTAKQGSVVLAARDGYIVIPRDPEPGIEALEQFDLDGEPAGTNTVTEYPRVPDGVMFTLADLQIATDRRVETVSADGRWVTRREDGRRSVLVGEEAHPVDGTPRFVTESGGALVISPDAKGLLLLSTEDASQLGSIDRSAHDLEVMGGYLVRPDRGEAEIHLPGR
ncbi:PQQ-binding-like beta-propeller repeat protein [Enemella sp. A6]|uniref:outer membrane protein assembly factor BamB family protein n=1 Tax=Enemella sp. A6 TaxID=3440152 RepID=UPI003EB95137